MKHLKFFILFSCSIQTFTAQNSIGINEAKEDFKIFENILKNGHPSLYEYIDKDSLDSLFTTINNSFTEDLTDLDVYKKMLLITSHIKDGNLLVYAPNTMSTDQYLFPLILKIINTSLYTDTDDFGIPVGSKIECINGKKSSEILEALKKYVSTDGYNLTKKHRGIEQKFGTFLIYEFGVQKEFTIDYTEPNGSKKSILLSAESFVKVKHRNSKRNSYYAHYHNQDNGFDFFDEYIANRKPLLHYKDREETAVLVVNSFNVNTKLFKTRLTEIFKELNKKKVKNLIIDIRNNEGGHRSNAISLYSFLTDSTFKQRTSEYVVSLSIPEQKHVIKAFFSEKEFLNREFEHHPKYDGWELTFDNMEAIMAPHFYRFKGVTYVLAGGNTFSTASSFTLLAKNDPNIILIGEETGGGYYFHTGGLPVVYEFPNSKINMTMAMEKVTHYVKDYTISKGTGVPPDHKTLLTVDQLISGTDPLLDYIFKQIHASK